MSDEAETTFTFDEQAFLAALEELYRASGAESRADGIARGIAPFPTNDYEGWTSWDAPGDQLEAFVHWFTVRKVIAPPTTGRFAEWKVEVSALSTMDDGAEHPVLVQAKPYVQATPEKDIEAPTWMLNSLRVSLGHHISAEDDFPITEDDPESVEATYRDILENVASEASDVLDALHRCLPVIGG